MSVTQLHQSRENQQFLEHEAYLRRQAVQLAAQLPETPQDALAVIAHMETLVKTFLCSTPA